MQTHGTLHECTFSPGCTAFMLLVTASEINVSFVHDHQLFRALKSRGRVIHYTVCGFGNTLCTLPGQNQKSALN